MRHQIRETEAAFHKIANDLHPWILDQQGLIPALRALIEPVSSKMRVAINIQNPMTPKRFPARLEMLLYRVVQEGLANVIRHAQAQSLSLSLERKNTHIHLALTDDGKGFDVRRFFTSVQRKGVGLFWMREHVELHGGRLSIDAAPGRGTLISIVVPLPHKSTSSSPE